MPEATGCQGISRQGLALTALVCVSLLVAPSHAHGLPLIGVVGSVHGVIFEPTANGALRPTAPINGASMKCLRQGRADLRNWTEAMHASITDGHRAMTPTEKANLETVKNYSRQVADALHLAEMRNEDERNSTAVPDADDLAARNAARGVPGLSRPGGDLSSTSRPSVGPRWRQMFPAAVAASPWGSDAEFLTAVFSGRHDPRLMRASTTMTEGGDSLGLIVPDEMISPWLDSGLAAELVRPRAQIWPMTTATRTVPCWDVSDRSGGTIAGLTLTWMQEGVTQTPQVAKPRAIKLYARVGAIFAEASNPLVQDGLDFQAQLGIIMSKATAYGMDKSFLFGTGSGQPLGIYNSAARIAVARAAAGLISYEDLTALFARMVPASVTKAVWVAHPSTIPQLTQLSVQIGAGGALIPVMTSADGSFSILTRPVVFSELAKPLGTPGDIGLFDFGEYVIGMRREVSIDTSNAPGWTRDALSFRVIVRLDGQPAQAAPIQPDNGAPTMSSFVTLE